MSQRGTRIGAAALMGAALSVAGILAGCAHTGPAAVGEDSAKRIIEEMAAAERAANAREAALVARVTRNESGKTVVSKVSYVNTYSTSYLVITKAGTRIVIDPYKILPGVEADIVLSTHKDDDHNDRAFYARTVARKSLYTLETFELGDVRATGIPASHYGDDFDPAKPSDVIYLVETDGLRLAFLGDICQTKLTGFQLEALGRVDVAFIIMENAPAYGYETARTLAMLRQIEPRLAFPLHPTTSVVEALGAELGGIVDAGWRFELGPEELAGGLTRIVRLAPLSGG